MVDGLVTVIIISALVVAVGGGLLALLNRPPGFALLAGLAVMEAVLVVQAVMAVGKMLTGERPDQLATFVGYLLTAVLVPPLGALFGWTERSRWGSALIAGAGLVVPVMVVRLQQVWHG